MDLSIVIPAYNEGRKIQRDVLAAAAFLAGERLRGEIIVVDDSSTDSTADAAARAPVPPGVERRVLRYQPHRGKGYAVRTGMRETRGRIVLFADSGLCVPFDNALRGMRLIEAGACDVAHGSRKMRGSRITLPQPFYRRELSRVFHAAVQIIMGIPGRMTDTQCGFKLYRGDLGRDLYAECRSDGFVFDVEVLLRALRKGCRVKEFPVEWCCDIDSRLHPARNVPGILRDLVAIRLDVPPR
jgi:dolichyl-phosphate beta-glucosyltransferase